MTPQPLGSRAVLSSDLIAPWVKGCGWWAGTHVPDGQHAVTTLKPCSSSSASILWCGSWQISMPSGSVKWPPAVLWWCSKQACLALHWPRPHLSTFQTQQVEPNPMRRAANSAWVPLLVNNFPSPSEWPNLSNRCAFDRSRHQNAARRAPQALHGQCSDLPLHSRVSGQAGHVLRCPWRTNSRPKILLSPAVLLDGQR